MISDSSAIVIIFIPIVLGVHNMTEKINGYYVDIKRGTWQKQADGSVQRKSLSGLEYVGWLTKQQLEGLDTIIRAYIDNIKEE